MRIFETYAKWNQICRALDLEGPYQISGYGPNGYQYLHKKGKESAGTAAIWNSSVGKGFIFDEDLPPEEKRLLGNDITLVIYDEIGAPPP